MTKVLFVFVKVMSMVSELLLNTPRKAITIKGALARAKGNGEECDERKRGMSAQRVAEMLSASLCRSNVQLLLRLRPPPHTVISTQAPGYGPLQWADCQLPWITISQRVLWAIRRRGAFHIEYSCCFTGYNRLENSQAMNCKHDHE